MNKKIYLPIILLTVFLVLLNTASVFASPNRTDGQAVIYFFWGDGCPHCEDEKVYLGTLLDKYPQAKVNDFEVWYNKDNQALMKKVAEAMGFEARGVPVTIIGDQYWIGFRDSYAVEFESAVAYCLENSCEPPVGMDMTTATPVPDSLQIPPQIPTPSGQTITATPEIIKNSDQIITLPIIGKVDLGEQSLAISTLIIGFVDGFNPCSLWVLSVLLALTLTSGSRTKIITVGLTFLIVTTFVYSLFILGVFTLFSYIGYLKWIQFTIALIAIGFGLVNMKDYLWYKEGVSFTISDKHKSKLYKNMRSAVITPRSLIGLITTTAALAVGVSLIEFSCTAGFPVIWSNIMIANNVNGLYFVVLLGLYMLIYLLDEIAVFAVAAISMKATRVEEKHGRLLKLVSGVIMLALGLVMLTNPEMMNNLSASLLVFGFALAFTWFIYILHQKILPKMGIYIGSGFKQAKKKKRH